jgi:fructose-1,6-bisphosphatase
MFYGNSNVASYIGSTSSPLTSYSGNIANVKVTNTLTTYGARVEAGYQYYAPTTNFTYTMWSNVSRFIMDPTGTITNGNVLLPSGNVDASIVTISSTQTVTNFKVTPNNGTTLVPSANITLSAGTGASYFFHANESKWYKIA